MYGSLIVLVENLKKPPRCSEDQDNLHYTLITFVLHYTQHSSDNAQRTQIDFLS